MDPVKEWERFQALELSDSQVRLLAGSKYFNIVPDPTQARAWKVIATQHVGVAFVDGLELRVTPKVGVSRLFELLSSSVGRVKWFEEDTQWSESNDLVSAIAGAFLTQSERVTRQGLLQGYVQRDERLYAIRGRVAIGRQLARNPGLPLPVEVTYDDYTHDIVENQLLAGACRVLLRIPSLPELLRTRLRRLDQLMFEVTPARPAAQLPHIPWTRLNERYRTAIELARLVLTNSTLDEGARRSATGTAFMIDMNKVFEDVVGIGLRDLLRSRGFDVKLQHNLAFGTPAQEPAIGGTPDIVVLQQGAYRAVADVKYIGATKGVSTDAVFQAVAYATHLGLDSCRLVYPEPQETSKVQIGGVTVYVEHLRLDLSPVDRADCLVGLADRLIGASGH